MRKGIKILAKVVSAIILLLIFLPLCLTIVLNIEPVQNFVVRHASSYASDYLGVEVSIDRIDLDLFSRVHISGFYVEDYNRDTMIYIKHAMANVDDLNIPKNGLRLSNAKTYGVKFYLRELSSGRMNISPIVEQLQKGDGKGKFRLYIDDIETEDLTFRLERLEHRNPKYGVDYGNMCIENIDARVEDLAVVRGVVSMDIKRLSGVEQSGFDLKSMSAKLCVNRGEILFDDLLLGTASSKVSLPKLILKGKDWKVYKEFVKSVNLSIDIDPSRLSAEDVAYFVPALEGRKGEIRALEGEFEGLVCDLEYKIKGAKLGATTNVISKGSIVGLPDWGGARYAIGIERLNTTSADVLSVAEGFLPGMISPKLAEIISSFEWADVRATVGGVPSDFRVVGNVLTGAGDVSGDVSVKRGDDGRVGLNGEIRSIGLDVGDIASVKNLHDVTSNITFNGSVGSAQSGGIIGDVSVDVESVDFGSYMYSNIEGKGTISGDSYLATVRSYDPNLKFDLKADLNLNHTSPRYTASLALKRADLNALGINQRDTTSVLSANVGLDLQGVLTEALDGYISIADAEYEYPQGKLEEDRIEVNFENKGEYKSVVLNSEYVTASYDSSSTYREAWDYVANVLRDYMPLLYNGDKREVVVSEQSGDLYGYTVMKITAGEQINSLLEAIVGGLVVAPDTNLNLRFNSGKNELSLVGESEAVEYKGWILAGWECDVNNRTVRDSLNVTLEADGFYLGIRSLMQNLSVGSGVSHNMVDVVATFDDEAVDGNSAMVSLTAELLRNAETNERNFHIDLTPSYFYNSSERWDMTSQGIVIEPSKISVNNFLIARPDQHLVVDGVASRSPNDEVRVQFNNFDASGLSVFSERIGYTVGGIFNGYALARSVFNKPELEASIAVDDITVNELVVAPQHITSTWDKELNRAHIVVRDRGLNKSVIDGYYSPDGNRYSADVTIANAHVDILKPFLKTVLKDMEGKADVFANVTGEGRFAVLSGSALISSFGATIGYTKVRYSAPSAKFTFDNNHVLASRIPMFDEYGNKGFLSVDVDLSHLRNVTYELSADVNKMLVMNTTASDNDYFYGHIFATGGATVKGDRRGAKMNIDVSSADHSKFYLPLSRKENVSYSNFVQFVKPDIEKVDSVDFLTRLIMSHDRRARWDRANTSMLDIDINVNVLPNIEMQLLIDPTIGDIIKAKGSGELSLRIVPEAGIFDMNGDVKISEGTYLFTLQNVINKLFTVVPGSTISWSGDPKVANVNIDAVYSTKTSLSPLIGSSVQGFDTSHAVPVDCYIKLTDKLTAPTTTFDIKVPNVAPEIQTIVQSALNDQHAIATQMFWLLAANSFSADDNGVTGASLSANTGFELLSNQLSNWLSGDDYNIILRYRPRNNISGDEVDVGFSKSWFNNRLIVELEGGYLSDASAQAMQKASNFVGEAFITWLIDPEGVMRFRGFTQTIDRYGENQGMQESGIGFYYNESFNTFAELRESLKNRFGGGRLKNITKDLSVRDTLKIKRYNNQEANTLDIIERDTLQLENIELINNN